MVCILIINFASLKVAHWMLLCLLFINESVDIQIKHLKENDAQR